MDNPYKSAWQREMEHRVKDLTVGGTIPRTASWTPTWSNQNEKKGSYFDDANLGMNMSSYPMPISIPRRSIEPPSRQPSPTSMSQSQSLSSGMSSSIDSALMTPQDGLTFSSHEYNPKNTRPLRARRGPLTPEQRSNAAFIRRIGACKLCRERKVKCNPCHRTVVSSGSKHTIRTTRAFSSFPSLVLALTILRRCLKHTFQKKNVWLEKLSAPSSASSRISCAWPRPGTPVGLGHISWLSSQESNPSPETNSVDSFEDEPSDSGDDFVLYSEEPAGQVENARLVELLTVVRSLLRRLPEDVAFGLAMEIQSLYYKFFLKGAYFTRTPYPHTPSSSNSHNPPVSTPVNSSSSGSGQKRRSDDGGDGWTPTGNGGDGDDNRKRLRKSPSSPGGSGKRWACPFYLREPHKYCVESDFGDYRKCSKSPGFTEVHRVKHHLLNCHLAIYCHRCRRQFKTEMELDLHDETPWDCDPTILQPILEGLDKHQKRQLKPRDMRSEEERWGGLYKICFPNDENVPKGDFIHYSQEYAILRHDVLAVLADETRFPDNIDTLRLVQRVRDTFDRNAPGSAPRFHPMGRSTLSPPPRTGDDNRSFTLEAPLHDSSSPWSPEDLQSDSVRGSAAIPILISHPNEEAGLGPLSHNRDLALSPYMGYQGVIDFDADGNGDGPPQFRLDLDLDQFDA